MKPYVQDRDFVLYVGDVRDVLRELPDGSVDCCVTSPPYWGLRNYGYDAQIGLEDSPDAYVAVMVAVFREVRRVLTDKGTLWLNLGDSYVSVGSGIQGANGQMATRRVAQVRDRKAVHGDVLRPSSVGGLAPKNLVGIPWRVAFALQDDGWYLRADIVWSKSNPMPESVTDRPTKAHEYVFLMSKVPHYFYDAEAIAEPATWYGPNGQPKSGPHAGQMHGRAGKEKNPTWQERKAAGAEQGAGWSLGGPREGRSGTQRTVHGKGLSHDLGDGLTRNARSVWTIQTQQYADAHFAVFPEELPRRCILAGCPEGGVVLDPFMGSGTTALVARKHGRRAIGIEINPEYAELAVKRNAQQTIFAENVA